MDYSGVDKPEIMPGMKVWVNPKNQYTVAMVHYSCDPAKDPERDGAEWYEAVRKGMPKAKWEKEYEIDSSTKAGSLVYGPDYCDFSPEHHLIKSFPIPEPYELLIGLDFGQRNPTSALIGAWTSDNRLYIIDEYYKPNIPSKSSREMFEKFAHYMGVTVAKMKTLTYDEKRSLAINRFTERVIDPTTIAKNRTKKVGPTQEIEYSVIEEFWDNGWDFVPGINDVQSGITRVREYFGILEGKARLYVFADKCPNLARELQTFRYKPQTEKQLKSANPTDQVVKKNDHACIAGNSLINTVNGEIAIKDLVGKEGYVYSYSNKLKRITVKPFKNVQKTGTRQTIKITLDDGSELITTEDHPFLLRGGDYIEADKLKEGDSLMPLYQSIDSHGHLTVRLNNGDKMFAHRLVYQDCVNELPEDNWKWNIHHRDEDKLNNGPENLRLMTRADHCGLHAKNIKINDDTRNKLKIAGKKRFLNIKYKKRQLKHLEDIRDLTKEWHSSEVGIQWHKKHGKECWSDENRKKIEKEKVCIICGKKYISKDGTGNCCSLNCTAMKCRHAREKKYGMTDTKRYKLIKEGKFNHKVSKIEKYEVIDVYNMYVEETNNFACEGVIIHNCDALKYLVATRPATPTIQQKAKTVIQLDIESKLRPRIMTDDDF